MEICEEQQMKILDNMFKIAQNHLGKDRLQN